MRVTVLRKFTVKTSAAINTGATPDACVTQAATDTLYGTGGEAGNRFTKAITVPDDGTAAEMNLYLTNDNYSRCLSTTCDSVNEDIDMTYGTLYATAQEQHAEGDSTDDHMLTYKLSSPYTVSLNSTNFGYFFWYCRKLVGAYECK